MTIFYKLLFRYYSILWFSGYVPVCLRHRKGRVVARQRVLEPHDVQRLDGLGYADDVDGRIIGIYVEMDNSASTLPVSATWGAVSRLPYGQRLGARSDGSVSGPLRRLLHYQPAV